MLRNAVTSRIFGARRNSSAVPRTRGSGVLSAPTPRRSCLSCASEPRVRWPALQRENLKSFCRAFYKKRPAFQKPPTCNTGVTKPLPRPLLASQGQDKRPMEKITKHVDWISATFPEGTEPEHVFPKLEFKYTGKGIHGYQTRIVNGETGAQFFMDGSGESMGTHMQLSGDALSELRKLHNIDDENIVNHISGCNGKIGRIDLAINIHDGQITPKTFFDAVRKTEVKTTARKSSYIWGIDDGIEAMTAYLGHRQSDRFLRCYDKNAQRKIVDVEAWIRFELELKRVWANGVQKAMSEHSRDAVINSQFNDFMGWGNREFNRAVSGASAPIDEIGRQQTNTEKWLMKQVIPALAKVCHTNTGFLASFMAAYRKAIHDLNNPDDTTSHLEGADL